MKKCSNHKVSHPFVIKWALEYAHTHRKTSGATSFDPSYKLGTNARRGQIPNVEYFKRSRPSDAMFVRYAAPNFSINLRTVRYSSMRNVYE